MLSIPVKRPTTLEQCGTFSIVYPPLYNATRPVKAGAKAVDARNNL